MTTAIKLTRLAPGWYEHRTGPGCLDRFEVTRCRESGLYGNGGYIWFLAWPGQDRPDSQFDTLTEAREQIAIEVAL